MGIDVCQKYLDVYIRPSGKLFQVTNDEKGIGKLVQTLKKIQPELIVVEARGMEIDVTVELTTAELSVAVINPRQARDFAKATVLARSLAPVGGAGSLVNWLKPMRSMLRYWRISPMLFVLKSDKSVMNPRANSKT